MNKKIVIMLAAVVAVVSVILVSILGQIPNFETNILVKEIVIEGYLDENNNLIPCKINANGDKIISLDEIEPDTILVLKVSVNPDNANNPDVRYAIDVTDGSVDYYPMEWEIVGRDSLSGEGVSFEAVRTFYSDKDWMMDRVDQFEWDVKMIARMAPYAAIQYIKKKIGYDDFLKDYAYTSGIPRADLNEVLLEIEEAAKPYASGEEWLAHIREYTEMLRMKEKERNHSEEGVRLMTLHAAKGLEFSNVLIIGANEGRMPYQKAKTDAQIEEERRLFYVGMTRAMDELKICYVKTKNGKETSPSRFVEELLENAD